MIESLRKALANYENFLEFIDEGHRIVVVVKERLEPEQFAIVKDVMIEYNASYVAYDYKTKSRAHWTIPQRKPYKKRGKSRSDFGISLERTKTPEPSVMLPKLPDDTRITVSYSRKVCPKQYESIGYSASIDVPLGFKDAANLIVTDCVEAQVAKRLKELES